MKIFQYAKMQLASLGHRPNQSPLNKTQLWAFVKNFLNLFLLFVYSICEPQSTKEYVVSIFITTVAILITIVRVSTLFKNAGIFNFIDTVENNINGRLKCQASRELYEKTNQSAETLSKIIQFIIVKTAVPAFVLPNAIVCYFKYFSTGLGTDAFELSLPIWFPFDWKNPIGYLIAVILQFIFTSTLFEYVAGFMCFGFTCAMFAFALAKDIKDFLNVIDHDIKSNKTRSKIMAELSELIQFTHLRELAKLFSEIYQIALVSIFLGCTGAICLALLMIQLDISYNGTDSVVLLQSCFCCFSAFFLVFAICEIGQRFGDAFSALYESFCQLEWYLYPIEVQQILVLLTLYGQKPVEIAFFGSSTCCREQFKKVLNKAYSYFMVLREFYG